MGATSLALIGTAPTLLTIAVLAVAGPSLLHVSEPPARGAVAAEAVEPVQAGPFGGVEGWAQVLTITPQWLVLQNQDGQQFPIAFDQVGLFAIRWPTTIERMSPTSLVEATGVSPSANQLFTSRVDVYEGAARGLVSPGMLLITPNGAVSRPIDFLFNPEVYGGPFPGMEGPIHSGAVGGGPKLTHVVGPILNRSPLQLGIGGNNAIAIFPADGGFQMSQITEGSPALLRPGDLVYFLASRATPQSLELQQLVVNKAMFIDQMQP
jgi:hypothetical protein